MYTRLQKKILSGLEIGQDRSLDELCESLGLDRGTTIKDCQDLAQKGVISMDSSEYYEVKPHKRFQNLTELPEKTVVDALSGNKLVEQSSLIQALRGDLFGLAINELKKKRVVRFESKGIKIEHNVQEELRRIDELDEHYRTIRNGTLTDLNEMTKQLKQRKLITIKPRKYFTIRLFHKVDVGEDQHDTIVTLTPDMLKDGSWRGKQFKEYDVTLDSADVCPGKPHPLRELSYKIRNVFLSMGYQEMDGPLVEAALYNFELLFTPQDHPAREMHDTYFLLNPSHSKGLPPDVVAKVRRMHERHFKYKFDVDTAHVNVLRTHTTAVTAHFLLEAKEFPLKLFSIGRVFRNETADSLHLPEFHQIEGVAVGDYTFADLISQISQFYAAFGITNLKFKPTFNPYTEPSMEIFVYYPQHEKYVELGNSGMFRPEMMECFGLGDKRAIAWGLALERLGGILYGTKSIKDLLGEEPDLDWLRNRETKWL